jgi:hypothetical protein
MSYEIQDFANEIDQYSMRWATYPAADAELEAIASTLSGDVIVHDMTIKTPMPPIQVTPAQTPFTNGVNLIVNRGKAGNLTGPQMAAVLSGATPPPPPLGFPVNVTQPLITVVGLGVSCNPGSWTNYPTTFQYIWMRNGTPISGATSDSYTLQLADGGTDLTCQVKATNSAGSGEAVSSNELNVPPFTPVVVDAPVISGNPVVAWRLECTTGSWANTPSSYAYQWMSDFQPIAGAVGMAHILTDADADTSVACQVTAINSQGSGSALSNSMEVSQGPPTNQTAPIASLNPTYVLCTGGSWTGGPNLIYAYQWYANSIAVAGANSSTWVFAGYEGQSALCAVAVSNSYGACPAVATNTVMIPSGAVPQPLEPPGISGTPTVGSTLSCIDGTWSNTPTTYAYQWLRNGVAISGATWGDGTYLIVDADDGTNLSCQVIASNSYGAGPVVESNSVLVQGTDA